MLQEIQSIRNISARASRCSDQRIFELTWQSQKGFVYDRGTFRQTRDFDYPGEGWGLTNDGRQIFMSDGTAEIRCWNPETLRETGGSRFMTVRVLRGSLNELEFVRGEIFANVWQTDRIARISPRMAT